MWCHVSVPQGEGGPVEFQVQESVVLPKPRHQARGQGRGELQVLVSKQQRSHCGVHTDTHTAQGVVRGYLVEGLPVTVLSHDEGRIGYSMLRNGFVIQD